MKGLRTSRDFPYTCQRCGKRYSLLYLMQLADRKRIKELKCVCGENIGKVYN